MSKLKEHKTKRHFFKDSNDHRKCTNCKGKGIVESYSETTNDQNIRVRTITEQSKCYKCSGSGIEKYIKYYAVFKNFKFDFECPIGVKFDFFSKKIHFSPRGWVSIFRWTGRILVWKFYLYRLFKKLKIPFDYYDIKDDDMLNFQFFGFDHWGGDYMSEYCTTHIDFLGFQLSVGWTPITKWIYCKKCDCPTPIIKGYKSDLCIDCKYPDENKITIMSNSVEQKENLF